jgi:hypothetical protein
LRAARLRIDGYRCVVPGCGRLAVVVDHIVSRKIGGTDTLDNLRSLCRAHDNQVKEAPSGIRRTDGKLMCATAIRNMRLHFDSTGPPSLPIINSFSNTRMRMRN